MTSPGTAIPEIVFRGTDGHECEAFVAAIEQIAFNEGWSEDPRRMLLFARTRLRDKALRWFTTLDPTQQGDWRLFVEALFAEYPSINIASESEQETSAPASPRRSYSPSIASTLLPAYQPVDPRASAEDDRRTLRNEPRRSFPVSQYTRLNIPSGTVRRLGTLRVVVQDDLDAPQYVSRGREPTSSKDSKGKTTVTQHDTLGTTLNRQDALVVCFLPLAGPYQIGCLNSPSDSRDLALDYSLFSGRGYQLRLTDGVVTAPEKVDLSVKIVSKVWTVLMDGSLEVSLTEWDPGAWDKVGRFTKRPPFKTTQVHLDTSGASIIFVKPGTPLRQNDTARANEPTRYEYKARLVFEAL